jgi:hypothetical protein
VEWSTDVGAADWIVERLLPFGSEAVAGFLPDVFGAYARVLHPWPPARSGAPAKMRWSHLALEAGVMLGPATQREELESCAASHGAQMPSTGSVDLDGVNALVDLLAPFTATPDSCWFGIWEGYGWMQGYPAVVVDVTFPPEGGHQQSRVIPKLPPAAPAGPRVQIPGRSLALYSGPIEAAAAFLRPPADQSPNLWWPEDHAWCVASEIDFCSTYVGGTAALIEQVLGDERLEAIPVSLEDRGIRD